MNCKKCGSQLVAGDLFCKDCGERVENVVNLEKVEEKVADQPIVSSNVVSGMENQMQQQPMFGQPMQQINQQPTPQTVVQPMAQQVVQPTPQTVIQPMPQQVVQPTPQTVVQPMPQQPTQPTPQTVVQPMAQQAVPQQPVYQQTVQQVPQQPTYNQPYNSAQQKSKLLPIIIGAVVIVVVALIIFLISKAINGGAVGPLIGNSGYSVKFEGFNMTVPNDLVYESNSSSLSLTNSTETWLAIIEVSEDANFSQLIANKNLLKSTFDGMGYITNNMQEKTYSGAKFLTLEAAFGGYNYILGFTGAGSSKVFTVTIVSESNKFDYSIVQTIAPILKNAKYSGDSVGIKGRPDFNLKSIIDNALIP